MIILTAVQADKVRGITTDGHALVPLPLKDGTFTLPLEVLDDPAHEAFADMLKVLPTREVDFGTRGDTIDMPVKGGEVERNPEIIKQYSYENASLEQRGMQEAFEATRIDDGIALNPISER
jgi:hypothetical protein